MHQTLLRLASSDSSARPRFSIAGGPEISYRKHRLCPHPRWPLTLPLRLDHCREILIAVTVLDCIFKHFDRRDGGLKG